MEDDPRRSPNSAASSRRTEHGGSRYRGPIAKVGIVGLLLIAVPVHAAPLRSSGRKGSCAEAFIGTPLDSRQLMALAPPARVSTDIQSYGDAPFARLHYERRRDRIQPAFVECRSPLRPKVTVKTYYMYSPAYLSAPQVAAGDAQDRILPRPTILPWIVDSILNPPD